LRGHATTGHHSPAEGPCLSPGLGCYTQGCRHPQVGFVGAQIGFYLGNYKYTEVRGWVQEISCLQRVAPHCVTVHDSTASLGFGVTKRYSFPIIKKIIFKN
jgi:hypothetical protein